MIKDMAFVAYSVADVPRATAFYRDTIGLTPGETFGHQWAEFDLGSTTFGVGNGSALGIAPGSQFSASFKVDDVAAMRRSLAERGLPVTDVMESPVCSSCFVTDPDGNRFGLHQRKPR
jgi:predicted enzyme related to lactoylglutathione lyase